MSNSQGFWSYVHADDEADSRRISQLARDVVSQYEMLTGETISLFLDIEEIGWGENWREKIEENLASIAFFIPVLTPRYFMRPECRSELQFFARRANDLGSRNLILPLLYVDFPALHDETDADDLIKLVCTFQWEDWKELRFADVTSEGYRKGVARLAARLVEANRQAEEAPAISLEEIPEDIKDESPGTIDLLANSEDMIDKLPNTINEITHYTEQISQIMRQSTVDIRRGNSQGKAFIIRQMIASRTASQLKDPVENIWSLSNEYATQLHGVDEGIRIIIKRALEEINNDPDTKANFCGFFESVLNMARVSDEAIENIKKMIHACEPLEKMSRDLRPVLRRLRQGLTILVESTSVSKEWVKLIESTNIPSEYVDISTDLPSSDSAISVE